MTILILSQGDDAHTEAVMSVLRHKNAPFVQYGFSVFPTRSALSVTINQSDETAFLQMGADRHDLKSFSSVWLRHPRGPQRPGNVSNKAFKTYIEFESQCFLEGFYYLTNHAFWVSPLPQVKAADIKYWQLVLAKELGFDIPDTCIGNDTLAASDLIHRHSKLAIKSIGQTGFNLELGPIQKLKRLIYEFRNRKLLEEVKNNTALYEAARYNALVSIPTQCFEPAESEMYLDQVPNCPVILQNYIPKKLELRITVVGKKNLSLRHLFPGINAC